MEHVTARGTGKAGAPAPPGDLLTHPAPGRRYLTAGKRSDMLALMRVYAQELRARGLAGIWGVEIVAPGRGHRAWVLYATPHASPDQPMKRQESGQ